MGKSLWGSLLLVVPMLVPGPAPAQPAAKAFGDVVVCESERGRREYCRADTRGGVVLARQLSSTRCVQGRTWDYDRGGIWVDDGCRAEFMLGDAGHGRPPPGSGYPPGGVRPPPRPPGGGHPPGWGHDKVEIVVCESIKGRPAYCPAETWRGVELVRQISSSPCIQGRSWGYERNRIWVDDGCRAEFAVRVGGGPGIGAGQVLLCESRGHRQEFCQTEAIRGARLLRQLSDAPCRRDVSWGWSRFGVWVSQGCRAEFEIY